MSTKDEATDVSDFEPLKLNSKKTPMDKLIWDYQRKESKIAWRWNWLQLQHHELQNQLQELDSFLAKFDLTSTEPTVETKPESQDQSLNSSGKKKSKPSPSPFEFLAYSDEEEQQHPLFSFVDSAKVRKFVDEKKQNLGEAKKKRGRPKIKPGLSASNENISVEIPPKNSSLKTTTNTPGKKHKSEKAIRLEKEDSLGLSNSIESMEEENGEHHPSKRDSPRPSSVHFPQLQANSYDKDILPSHFRVEEIYWEEDDFREDEIDEFYDGGSGSDVEHVGRRSFTVPNICCRCSCCRDSDTIQTRSRQAQSHETVEVPQGTTCSCTHHCRCRQKKGAVRGRKNPRSRESESNNVDSPKIPPKPKTKIFTPTWRCQEESDPAPTPDPASVSAPTTSSHANSNSTDSNSSLATTVVEPTSNSDSAPNNIDPKSTITTSSSNSNGNTPHKLNSEVQSSDEDTSDEAFASRHLFRELLERKAIAPQTQQRPSDLQSLPTDFFVVGDALDRKRKGKLLSKREREKLENLEQLKEKFNTKLQKMKEKYLNSPKFERNWDKVGETVLNSPKISNFADSSKMSHKKKNKKNWRRRRPLFILSSSSESSDLEFEEQGPGLSSSSHNGVNINEKLEVKLDVVEAAEPPPTPRGRPRLKNSRGRPRIRQPSSPEQYFNPISIPENEEAFEAYLEKARIFRNSEISWEIVLKPLCVNPATNRPKNVLVFRKKVPEETPQESNISNEAPSNPASDDPPASEAKDITTPPEPILPKMETVQ